ncbi:DNA/RNA non-specific endonuclease [Alistipes sp.]|uniref:DNA/RNA non-specific endonuclease n=1 Tax=Alistipes sp. TaxID=1872444 RepID=UPI003A835FA0
MKRIFTLLVGGLAALLVACDSDKTETGGSEWFAVPECTVDGTVVTARCETKFGEGILTGSNAGFAYAEVTAAGVGAYEHASNVSVTGNLLTATLDGLQPETLYVVYAYADFGSSRMQSTATSFRTGQATALPDPDPDRPAFGTPSASDISASGATLSCGFTFGELPSDYTLRFEYRAASASGYESKPVESGTGVKSVVLTGLSSSTEYEFRLCAEWEGNTYTSPSARFTTLASGGGDTPSGQTKYAGWAELPVEKGDPDLYYAYHICPDFRAGGHLARNYTVCYSAEHHCPVWVAAPRHACYEVKGTNRTDAYGKDPDIRSDIQYNSKNTGGGCNKGHMLGSAERLVTRAVNQQVFYYTNIAPQYSDNFNTGGAAWNTLESFVDGQVCADTTYVVIGTYFEPFTDAYGKSCSPATISFGGRNDVTRPSMFYYLILRSKKGNTGKSVYDLPASELKCAAFVLRHNIEKSHTPQAKDVMSVEEIEKLTGFTFFANVPNAPKSDCNPSDWGL